ncbi:hypothetical protein D1O33_25955 (plasmid) [Rhodococcus rhodochrous]|uniref:transposase n=1 Tax=Rhodococcus rhodochrous TaxID=1829 RepID=UPI00132E7929|nr:hypothetical protein D1O33_25955 [Rhodococcus rhodochrous]
MRLAVEARRDLGSKTAAIKQIADQLGLHPEALRTWVRQAERGPCYPRELSSIAR